MSLFSEAAADLNEAILDCFGDDSPSTLRRRNKSEESVTLVWLESDSGVTPIQAQCKASVFTGALPEHLDFIVRSGITYRVQDVKRLDGDWLSIELRIMPSNEI